MRFSIKFLLGFLLFLAGAGAVGYGAVTLTESLQEQRTKAETRAPEKRERVFAVSAGVIQNQDLSPTITAYGEIRSWRTLELRASSGGYIVELADTFRDGEAVDADAFLFRIDPTDYVAAAADARAAVAEAEADLSEAVQGLEVGKRELAAADMQRDLRASALNRQQDLLRRGVATSSVVEEAEMSLASAEQTAASRSQMLLASQIKIDRNRLRLERARIAQEEAERNLAETEHLAPFRGLISDVTAALGGLATPNERLALLIDPTALEAVFRLTNAQFARLLDDNGQLRSIDLTITLELDDTPLLVQGVIDRAGATVGEGKTGRQIFAKLSLDDATLLRPGDFVSVTITEPPLSNVALAPASAVTEEGEILLITDDLRLEAAQTRILRRVGEDVILADAPEGARYATDRSPQLGKGVKVRIIGDNDAAPVPAPDLVSLDPSQQEKMIAFVQANTRMPEKMKNRILTRLRTGKAPQRMVDRLTARMGG